MKTPGHDTYADHPGRVDMLGLPVAGYRPQTSGAVATVNVNKMLEEQVLSRLDELAMDSKVDPRWLAVGRTHLEIAFMAINRAVFKPERVKL